MEKPLNSDEVLVLLWWSACVRTGDSLICVDKMSSLNSKHARPIKDPWKNKASRTILKISFEQWLKKHTGKSMDMSILVFARVLRDVIGLEQTTMKVNGQRTCAFEILNLYSYKAKYA